MSCPRACGCPTLRLYGCPELRANGCPDLQIMPASLDRFEVRGYCKAVLTCELTRVVFDDRRHRTAGEIAIRQHADVEKVPYVLQSPAADSIVRIGSNVRHLLFAWPFGIPAKFMGVPYCAEAAAGGMALTTMAKVADEVGATVPFIALARIGLESSGTEVAGLPRAGGAPRGHHEWKVVLAIGLLDRLETEQVSLQDRKSVV